MAPDNLNCLLEYPESIVMIMFSPKLGQKMVLSLMYNKEEEVRGR